MDEGLASRAALDETHGAAVVADEDVPADEAVPPFPPHVDVPLTELEHLPEPELVPPAESAPLPEPDPPAEPAPLAEPDTEPVPLPESEGPGLAAVREPTETGATVTVAPESPRGSEEPEPTDERVPRPEPEVHTPAVVPEATGTAMPEEDSAQAPAEVAEQTGAEPLAGPDEPGASDARGAPAEPDAAAEPDDTTATDPRTTGSARAIQRAATRAAKESLIAQAELVALTAPPRTAPAQMKDLLTAWKQAGRTTKAEDDALWERFNQAQSQLFTRLDLLREQRQAEAAEARRAKESLIATAEEVATRADLRQAADTMTALMAQWKAIGGAGDDKALWLRFKAAQDQVFAKRTESRRAAEADQRTAADQKRAIIAQVQGLVGAPDLRAANADLKRLGDAFRQAGYAGKALNADLTQQFRDAQQDFYAWIHHEPTRRRETGEQPVYGRRSRLVQEIEVTRVELENAEIALTTTDPGGAKRSHGTSITVTLGASGRYANAAADALRLRLRLTELENQLARLDATLGRA